MNRFFGYAFMLGLLSIPGFAASNSKSITFPDKLTVGTTQLPAGDYKVTWTGSGPEVQVSLAQKNAYHPLTVTVPAKLVQMQDGQTGLTIDKKNGVEVLETIQLNNIGLVFGDATAQAQ